MKNKERKILAKKIAKAESIIQANSNSKAVERAKNEIFELSSQIDNLEDMLMIDELVQEILEKELS